MITRIAGGTVVTMDENRRVLSPADVWIEDRQIVAVGEAPALHADYTIDASQTFVIPGLIQPHVHLCQTLFRGLADDLELLDWLAQRIWPLEAAHDEQSLYVSALLGIAELFQTGTTTILDMGTVHHTSAIFQALAETGIRAFAGKCIMDDARDTPLHEETDAALQESADLLSRWHHYDQDRLQYAFAPRFTLSCTDEAYRMSDELAQSHHALVHTHAAENREEVARIRASRNLSPIEHFDSLGILSPRLVMAHGIWLTEVEQHLVGQSRARLVH
ncbi:MAG: amidohydrolase family protein, partial [Firmicutes bacterium]|nr:amidohydrolase family protein [Bacillota bacterium]